MKQTSQSEKVSVKPENSRVQFNDVVPALLLKKVEVRFGIDRSIVGILMRNSWRNETLCIDTNYDVAGQSGKFFFQPNEAISIKEVA